MLISISRQTRRLLTCILTGGFLLGSVVNAQAPLSMPEDSLPQLRRFLETGIQQSPTMILRGFDEAGSDGNLMASRAQRLPNLGGFADLLYAREDRGDFIEPQNAEKLYYRMSVTQPLFHWGVLTRNVRSAEIRREMESGNTRRAYQSIVIEIRRKYLELMLHKSLVERNRFWLQLTDEELTEAEGKRRMNIISEAALQQVQQHRKRTYASVGYVEDQYLLAKRMFCRMVGVSSISEEDIADGFPQPDFSKEPEVAASMVARFASADQPVSTELDMLQQEMEIGENDLKNTRMGLRPKVNAVAGVTQDEQSYSANVGARYEYKSVYGGISVNWTVFDSFATRGATKAALARLRKAEAAYVDRKQAIIDDAESYARQLKFKAIEVEVEDQELVSAQNHLKFMETQHERGEASDNDLAQARMNLMDHWRTTMQTRYNYWERMFTLLSLIEADPAVDMLPGIR